MGDGMKEVGLVDLRLALRSRGVRGAVVEAVKREDGTVSHFIARRGRVVVGIHVGDVLVVDASSAATVEGVTDGRVH